MEMTGAKGLNLAVAVSSFLAVPGMNSTAPALHVHSLRAYFALSGVSIKSGQVQSMAYFDGVGPLPPGLHPLLAQGIPLQNT